jgi:hypothetical protein
VAREARFENVGHTGVVTCSDCDKGRVFAPESTKVTLSQACDTVGLDSANAHLMRLGTNAVFHLTAPVVARIARIDSLDEMTRTVRVACWLDSVGYPAVRALAFDQPIVIDGSAATFWEALGDGEDYALVPEVAQLLSSLHALTAPVSDLHRCIYGSALTWGKGSQGVCKGVAMSGHSPPC